MVNRIKNCQYAFNLEYLGAQKTIVPHSNMRIGSLLKSSLNCSVMRKVQICIYFKHISYLRSNSKFQIESSTCLSI